MGILDIFGGGEEGGTLVSAPQSSSPPTPQRKPTQIDTSNVESIFSSDPISSALGWLSNTSNKALGTVQSLSNDALGIKQAWEQLLNGEPDNGFQFTSASPAMGSWDNPDATAKQDNTQKYIIFGALGLGSVAILAWALK